jgi:hypothetical protein
MRRLFPLLLALALAPAALAAAPIGPVFGLRAVGNPRLGYFVYPASAGAVIHGAISIANTGDRSGVVKLYPADATTGATSGTVYVTDSAPSGAGTWISLGSSSLTLKPGQRTQVPFTVHVPGGAGAGDYVGGIVAETVLQRQGAQSSQKANVQVRVRNLSIVAVEVNIPGPQVAKFTIGAVNVGGTKGRQQVFVHVTNDGNVLRKPRGSVTIQNPTGVAIQTIPFRMDSFLPHTTIDYPVQLKRALPPGNYVASVHMTYDGTGAGGKQMSSAAPQFKVTQENIQHVFKPGAPTRVGPGGVVAAPASSSSLWQWIAIGLGAVLLAGGGYFFAVMRQRRPVTVTVTPIPPAPPPAAAPAPTADPAPTAAPTPDPAPAAAAAPVVAAQAPAEAALERCEGFHYWQVDWERGELGPDGVLVYPHRCRSCGIEVKAADIGDAATKAAAIPT